MQKKHSNSRIQKYRPIMTAEKPHAQPYSKNTNRSRLPKKPRAQPYSIPAKQLCPLKIPQAPSYLQKKLTLPYSPIRQLKNRNRFYPMPSSARKAYPDQFNAFGIIPLLSSTAFDDKRALPNALKYDSPLFRRYLIAAPRATVCHKKRFAATAALQLCSLLGLPWRLHPEVNREPLFLSENIFRNPHP